MIKPLRALVFLLAMVAGMVSASVANAQLRFYSWRYDDDAGRAVLIWPGESRSVIRYRIETDLDADQELKYTLTAVADGKERELLLKQTSAGVGDVFRFKAYVKFEARLRLRFMVSRRDDSGSGWVRLGFRNLTLGEHTRTPRVQRLIVDEDGIRDDDNDNGGGGSGDSRIRIYADSGDFDRVDVHRLDVDGNDRDVGSLVDSVEDDFDEGEYSDSIEVDGDQWYAVTVYASNGDTFETDVFVPRGSAGRPYTISVQGD